MQPIIGIFGGTFDPIHNGHLHLAIRLSEIYQLQEVWFIPARYSPFKIDQHTSPIEKRIEMIGLAIEDIPHFRVVDIEAKRTGPSYTIDTLRIIAKQSPSELRLLMGSDAVPSFHEWKDSEEIIQLAPPLIACRSADFSEKIFHKSPLFEKLKEGMTQIPIMEISSTEIRERFKKCLCCIDLLPAKVIDFIIQNGLYLT